jgi:hypothetical protein
VPAVQRLGQLQATQHPAGQQSKQQQKKKIWRPKKNTGQPEATLPDPVPEKEGANCNQLPSLHAAPALGGQEATNAIGADASTAPCSEGDTLRTDDVTDSSTAVLPSLEDGTPAQGGQEPTAAVRADASAVPRPEGESTQPEGKAARSASAQAETSDDPVDTSASTPVPDLAVSGGEASAETEAGDSSFLFVGQFRFRADDPMLIEVNIPADQTASEVQAASAEAHVTGGEAGPVTHPNLNGPVPLGPAETLVSPQQQTPAQGSDELQSPSAAWTPVRRLKHTPSPPKDSESARRRFKGFAYKIRKPRPSLILKLPSPAKETTPKTCMPLRSRRIAAQSLSRIPASKRGEYLVLKRLGHATDRADSAGATKDFNAFFEGQPEDTEALQELFKDDRAVGARKRQRRRAGNGHAMA